MQNNSAEIQTPTPWNPIGRSTAAPPAVIAQQYSSAAFPPIELLSHKENFGARLKYVISFFC
jgi:hypothetical protein